MMSIAVIIKDSFKENYFLESLRKSLFPECNRIDFIELRFYVGMFSIWWVHKSFQVDRSQAN